MAAVQAPISDMLVTVKARELQRGMLAEMRSDRPAAARHFLAAAQLELVLADDYAQAGQLDLAWRSRLSAASYSGAPVTPSQLVNSLPRCCKRIQPRHLSSSRLSPN